MLWRPCEVVSCVGQDFLQQDLNNRLLAHQVPPVQSLFGHPQLDIAGLPGQNHPHFLGQRMQHRAYEGLTPIVSTPQPLMVSRCSSPVFAVGLFGHVLHASCGICVRGQVVLLTGFLCRPDASCFLTVIHV